MHMLELSCMFVINRQFCQHDSAWENIEYFFNCESREEGQRSCIEQIEGLYLRSGWSV
jgi:hypothetical protein